MLDEAKFKGDLKGFPVEIVDRMIVCMKLEDSELTDSECVNYLQQSIHCAFEWCNTIEGSDFWSRVVSERDFTIFVNRYPKQESKSPYKGYIKGFPEEIVARLIAILKDGNSNLTFNSCITMLEEGGGSSFIWNKTVEGHVFWKDVMNYKDFNLFFRHYPKTKSDKEPKATIKKFDIIDHPERFTITNPKATQLNFNTKTIKKQEL